MKSSRFGVAKRLGTGLLSLWLLASVARAQVPRDTLRLTLDVAEQQFTQRNFTLLAQRYAIEAARAAVIQARLLPNPNLQYQHMLLNQRTGDVLPAGRNGEVVVQVQQLVQLAGKRNKAITSAQIGTEISEYQFFDLVRTLTLELRTSFYDVFFLNQSRTVYEREIPVIQNLVRVYQEQYARGNVAYKEVVRLQSLQLGLENDLADLNRQIADRQASLKVLLGDATTRYLEPRVDPVRLDSLRPDGLTLDRLLADAQESRYDLRAQEAQTRLEAANLRLQNAFRTPDVALGYFYDKAAGVIPNYHALTLTMDLPVFNRNQGNIRLAQSRVAASQQYLQQAQVGVQNDVLNAFTKLQQSERLYRTFDRQFLGTYDRLIDGVVESYQKRNISLLEFTDFLDSYTRNVNQYNGLQADRMRAIEELRFAVGKDVLIP